MAVLMYVPCIQCSDTMPWPHLLCIRWAISSSRRSAADIGFLGQTGLEHQQELNVAQDLKQKSRQEDDFQALHVGFDAGKGETLWYPAVLCRSC